jgi:hypothetical protein
MIKPNEIMLIFSAGIKKAIKPFFYLSDYPGKK